MKAESIVIPESACPQCGYRMNRADEVQDRGLPEAGDVSICLDCSALLIFGPSLLLRKPTASEVSGLMADREKWADVERIQRIIQRRGRLAS